jgi:hypothetical protein
MSTQTKLEASATTAPKPASLLSRIKWESIIILTVSPLLGAYGALFHSLQSKTWWFCVFMYFFSMIGMHPPRNGSALTRQY